MKLHLEYDRASPWLDPTEATSSFADGLAFFDHQPTTLPRGSVLTNPYPVPIWMCYEPNDLRGFLYVCPLMGTEIEWGRHD